MEELLWTEVYNSCKMNQNVYTYVDEYIKHDFLMLNIMLTHKLLPVMSQTRRGVTNQFPAFHYFSGVLIIVEKLVTLNWLNIMFILYRSRYSSTVVTHIYNQSDGKIHFWKIKDFLNGEINKQSFINPHPYEEILYTGLQRPRLKINKISNTTWYPIQYEYAILSVQKILFWKEDSHKAISSP